MKYKDRFKEDQLKVNCYKANQYECKNCGHKQLVPKFMEKNLCDWCGVYVFREEKDEFKFRLKERLMK